MKNNFSKKDRIFLAGASGMAGSAILRALKKNGYGENKIGGELLLPNRKSLNLLNFNELKYWFEKNRPNVVIIAAARVGGILANSNFPADFILENIKIQSNIIELSCQYGVKRLLFLGSSCIYPKFALQPIKEESLLTGELESTNEWYAIAKIAGIKLCEALRIQKNFDAISLMPTNLYGPGDNYNLKTSHVMAALIKKFSDAKATNESKVICWGTGSPLREFMHVDDLGDAVLFVLENWDPEMQKFVIKENKYLTYLNVGTGKDISIKELAMKIAKKVGFQGEIIWDKSKPDGTPKKQLDISRIKSLGWAPKIELDKGIEKTISIYKEENSYKKV